MEHNEILSNLSYFSLMERSTLPIFWLEKTPTLIYANKAACDYLGYTLEELYELDFKNVDINYTPEKYAENIKKLEEDRIIRFETTHRRKDGTLVDVEVVRNYVDERGIIISYVFDISEKNKTARRLALITGLMEMSRDNIFISDMNTRRLLYVNRHACESLGYAEHELLSMRIDDIRKPLDGGCCLDEHMENLRAAGSLTVYGLLVRKDGSEFPIETSVNYIKLDGVEYNVAIVRDITERLEKEQEIHQKNEELEELNLYLEQKVYERTRELEEHRNRLEERVQEESAIRHRQDAVIYAQQKFVDMSSMLNSIAHHWRQPINAIGLMVQEVYELFCEEKLDKPHMDYFHNTSMRLVVQLSKTIDQFRSFYQPDEAKKEFEVIRTLMDFIKLIKLQMAKRNIDFKMSCVCDGRNLDCMEDFLGVSCRNSQTKIFGIESELKQAVISIIENSAEAIEKNAEKTGMRKGFINIDILPEEKQLCITIADNGGGVTDDILKKMFNPYFTTKRDAKATGLGLFMSKLIIEEQFGGTMTAANTQDGLAVTLKIPFYDNSVR